MQSPQPFELLASHALVWERIQPLLNKNRIPHAFLFIGPRHANLLQFAQRLMAIINCQTQSSTPCGQCQPCRLLKQDTHPDVCYIRQDTASAPIKIDQIRELQQDVYRTPQSGGRRFIVIDPADKLNSAAANALLKILEEPPAHTVFILLAEHINSLPATIMSRCQNYVFHAASQSFDYLAIAQFYPEATERAKLFKQQDVIMAALTALREKKTTACSIAAEWSVYPLNDLLWFLYLITAQAIQSSLLSNSQCWQPTQLFSQLDQINGFLRKIQQNITLNQTLTLEVILMGFM